jgi:hypothetical protein
LAFGLARLGAGLGWHRLKKQQQNIQGKQSLPPAGGFFNSLMKRESKSGAIFMEILKETEVSQGV